MLKANSGQCLNQIFQQTDYVAGHFWNHSLKLNSAKKKATRREMLGQELYFICESKANPYINVDSSDSLGDKQMEAAGVCLKCSNMNVNKQIEKSERISLFNTFGRWGAGMMTEWGTTTFFSLSRYQGMRSLDNNRKELMQQKQRRGQTERRVPSSVFHQEFIFKPVFRDRQK